jgi:hypothetical protein
MTDGSGQRKDQAVWAAGGAAILDYSGAVRNIMLVAPTVDDLAIQRMVPVLDSVQRRMELFPRSDFAETGADLVTRVDETIARWDEMQELKVRTQDIGDRIVIRT